MSSVRPVCVSPYGPAPETLVALLPLMASTALIRFFQPNSLYARKSRVSNRAFGATRFPFMS